MKCRVRRRACAVLELVAAGLLVLSACHRAPNPEEAYAHARQTFIHGDLLASQEEAEDGYKRFVRSRPEWALRFRVLEAESLMWRGMYDEAIRLLEASPRSANQDVTISILAIEAVANTRLHKFDEAEQKLAEADWMCAGSREAACGGTIRAHGLLGLERGQFAIAERYLTQTLDFARAYRDTFLQSTALLNLGAVALQQSHFDLAIEHARSALVLARALNARDMVQAALGNLGWAYYKLGDSEDALDYFTQAGLTATELKDDLNQLRWLATSGYVYLDRGDYAEAQRNYSKALTLAQKIDGKEDIVSALINLSLVHQRTGRFSEADDYSERAIAMARADGNRLDELYALLIKAQVAAQQNDWATASKILHEVANDPQSDPSLRWEAQHSLARLDENLGHNNAANREYEAALCTFETERSSLHREESKLPFFTNASHIYDDYINFLMNSGRPGRALEAADYSRARTLAEGLGYLQKGTSCVAPPLNPENTAAQSGAIILYYSLGKQHSYLWAITRSGVRSFPLPPSDQIDAAVHRYRQALENGEDVLTSSNADGLQLFQTLIAPVSKLVGKGAKVVIVPDGSLNSLNFEALLAPGTPTPHYWIEDAVITNAHSLRLLMAKSKSQTTHEAKLLLIGDPVAHGPEFPALPNAKLEIAEIQKHFAPPDLKLYANSSATPSAFLESKPEQFSYIHFVTHAVASSQVPLDSAVILSPPTGEDSYKLYARDIIQHPLRARVVTISACYGAGTRSYSGEGLIGLSWAFLRAGAQSTIGALWEVSDVSTPKLMDNFYKELQQGRTADVALHDAKLELLRSGKSMRKPFYWAPFQLYGGASRTPGA